MMCRTNADTSHGDTIAQRRASGLESAIALNLRLSDDAKTLLLDHIGPTLDGAGI